VKRRPRRRIVAGAAVVALLVAGLAIGLGIGLTRSSAPARSSSAPTEGTVPVRVLNTVHQYTFAQAVAHGVVPSLQAELLESGLPLCGTKGPTGAKARAELKKVIARNDGDTCMADPRKATYGTGGIEDFFALNAVPAGSDLLRYTDSAGWSVTYPRRFHTVAYLIGPGFHVTTEGASFANFRPVPTPFDSGDDPGAGPTVPPHGVLFELTATQVFIGPPQVPDRDTRFPLSLGSSVDTHTAGSAQSGSLQFRAYGQTYDASFLAGPKARRSDLQALQALVESISFPTPKPGTQYEQFSVLDRTSAYPLRSATLLDPPSSSSLREPFYLVHDRAGFHAIAVPGHLRVGGKLCTIRFDQASDRLFCSAGARWDRQGRLIALPRHTSPPDLSHFDTLVSFAGHVLVNEQTLLPAPPQ
jgi:hypothetical protein